MQNLSSDGVHVAALYLYPVKGCGALRVPALRIDRWGGAEGDRRWAVVNAGGEVTWQGAWPRLALVQPRIVDGALQLDAPGHGRFVVDEGQLQPCTFQIWNEPAAKLDRFDGHDAGDAAATWLSAVVGAPLRLVRMGDEAVGRGAANRLHIVSRASCDEAQAQVQRAGGAATELLRYRPNIVLDGPVSALQPFAEDFLLSLHWHDAASGEGALEVSRRCVRCVVPNVSPSSGETDERVLAALAQLSAQRFPGEPVCFGVYAQAIRGARLHEGQAVSLAFSF
jgi:uncharacterized protein YcbX